MLKVFKALYVKVMTDFGEKYGHCVDAIASLPCVAMKAATLALLDQVVSNYDNHRVVVWTDNNEVFHVVNFRKEADTWIAYDEGENRIATLEEIWLYQ